MPYVTRLASLASYEKGRVEVIDDDPKNYAFSNIFEVASQAKPFEQVAVAKNFEYVLEAVRVEGTSGWRAAFHDQPPGEMTRSRVYLPRGPVLLPSGRGAPGRQPGQQHPRQRAGADP